MTFGGFFLLPAGRKRIVFAAFSKQYGNTIYFVSSSLTGPGGAWYKYMCFSTPPLATDGRMRSTAEEQGAPYVADRLGIVEPAGFNMPIISFLGRKPT
jgi:hypothetical protein